ncbi:MAG: ATP-binding cassette domain-containing protein [Candidatus Zipacnadales bacterium]
MQQTTPPIYVCGLTKRFGEILALEKVDLTVRRGEIVGLLGSDGAGKTTLMRILCGLLPPTAGSVTVAGHDVVAAPESAKSHLGYLPQRFGLWDDLTVDENLRFCADLFGVAPADFVERRIHLLQITRLMPFVDRLAYNLSGGMRQKLGLICTLIHRPEVLLLDEPTTGVDPASRRDFWRLLHNLPGQGVTILLSTPYMDEAERCNRLVLMHEGRVLISGTPTQLKQTVRGNLFSMMAIPQRKARYTLLAMPGVHSVTTFGDQLHVATDITVSQETLTQHLQQAGVELISIAPITHELEDVFIAALARGEWAGE